MNDFCVLLAFDNFWLLKALDTKRNVHNAHHSLQPKCHQYQSFFFLQGGKCAYNVFLSMCIFIFAESCYKQQMLKRVENVFKPVHKCLLIAKVM